MRSKGLNPAVAGRCHAHAVVLSSSAATQVGYRDGRGGHRRTCGDVKDDSIVDQATRLHDSASFQPNWRACMGIVSNDSRQRLAGTTTLPAETAARSMSPVESCGMSSSSAAHRRISWCDSCASQAGCTDDLRALRALARTRLAEENHDLARPIAAERMRFPADGRRRGRDGACSTFRTSP